MTVNDVVLDNLTNVRLLEEFDFSKVVKPDVRPAYYLNPSTVVTSGTLIKVRSSGDLIGFVERVTPAQLQNSIVNSIISGQGL